TWRRFNRFTRSIADERKNEVLTILDVGPSLVVRALAVAVYAEGDNCNDDVRVVEEDAATRVTEAGSALAVRRAGVIRGVDVPTVKQRAFEVDDGRGGFPTLVEREKVWL